MNCLRSSHIGAWKRNIYRKQAESGRPGLQIRVDAREPHANEEGKLTEAAYSSRSEKDLAAEEIEERLRCFRSEATFLTDILGIPYIRFLKVIDVESNYKTMKVTGGESYAWHKQVPQVITSHSTLTDGERADRIHPKGDRSPCLTGNLLPRLFGHVPSVIRIARKCLHGKNTRSKIL